MVDFIGLEITLLLTLLNVLAGLGIGLFLFKNRIKFIAFQWANEFKEGLLEDIKQNPDTIEQIFTPFIGKFLKKYGVPEPGQSGGGDLKLFGFKIPREIVGAFLGKMVKQGAEEAGATVFG